MNSSWTLFPDIRMADKDFGVDDINARRATGYRTKSILRVCVDCEFEGCRCSHRLLFAILQSEEYREDVFKVQLVVKARDIPKKSMFGGNNILVCCCFHSLLFSLMGVVPRCASSLSTRRPRS